MKLNEGDAINFIRAIKMDSGYNPSQSEIVEAMKDTFKDWAYRLFVLNEGDAINFAKATGLPKEVFLKEGFKYWAYKFLAPQGTNPPRVIVNGTVYVPEGK